MWLEHQNGLFKTQLWEKLCNTLEGWINYLQNVLYSLNMKPVYIAPSPVIHETQNLWV